MGRVRRTFSSSLLDTLFRQAAGRAFRGLTVSLLFERALVARRANALACGYKLSFIFHGKFQHPHRANRGA